MFNDLFMVFSFLVKNKEVNVVISSYSFARQKRDKNTSLQYKGKVYLNYYFVPSLSYKCKAFIQILNLISILYSRCFTMSF